jgi:DNA-binding MarR family transcriptional regulator
MQKGRLTKEEQGRRFKLLIKFIFTFRYATRKQLDGFARLIIGLRHPQWLVDYSIKQGLITSYQEPVSRSKIYHLTRKGKKLIKIEEPKVSHYHFEKRHAGMNTFGHHNLLVESFFLLQKQLKIKEWICEWVLRINKHKRDKIPDGLIILLNGAKIAMEVETSYKTKEAWKMVVTLYRYDIEKISKYDAVLIVAQDMLNYEGIKRKLYTISPEFCGKNFILTEVSMLGQGICFYQTKTMSLTEAFNLLKEKGQSDGKRI